MDFDISVTGIEEACASLKDLPARTVKYTFAKALAAAAVPLVESMEARCPVDTGELRQHVQSKIGIFVDASGGSVDVGFFPRSISVTDANGKKRRQDAGDASVARFVEYGHRIVPHATKAALDKNGRKAYRKALESAGLDEVQPHPFMRPSFTTSSPEAVEIFIEKVGKAMVEDKEVS